MFLRDWYGGDRASVAAALSEALGVAQGRDTLVALDSLLGLLVREGRRPVYCHPLHCLCVGADEAVITNLLHLAVTGGRESAMLIASLLLPADHGLLVVGSARIAGLGILRTTIRDKKHPAKTALH